jgi:uncharacterized protein (TIGR02453 family)
MPAEAHFDRALFRFLEDLERNNDRDWFQANKERYERQVKAPILSFIVDFGARLQRISPHFLADPRPVGGSMFRIFRDTRFSKDKRPYKTNAGVHFRHEAGKDVHAPGFYLHLAPGEVFAAAGIWHPDSRTATQIREAILEAPDRWRGAVGRKAFRDSYELSGDSLTRPPRGVDRDHPLVEDLKRKDYIAVAELTEAMVCAPGFAADLARLWGKAGPFTAFLCGALGQPF